MDLLGRVETLESALQMLIEELAALRVSVERIKKNPPTATPRQPKPTAAEKLKLKPDTPKRVHPWDDPKILSELEACRPRILELLGDGTEVTKQGSADALKISPRLAGRTLSYMMTVKKEIEVILPAPTEAEPDPKKRFRLKENG